MEKIIIDTDIGIDDAFALRYAMLTQHVLGITTVNGNVNADKATKNAKLFCDHYGLRVPVCKGASRPLVLPASNPDASDVHGDDGLGNCLPNTFDAYTQDNAVNFIINTVKANPHEVTLVTIGPLTNIALALNICPELAGLIKKLVIMGGAFGTKGHTGNMSNFAEFNVWKDPQAADQVMQADIPTVIVPMDVTMEVLLTPQDVDSLHDPFLSAISRVYLEFYTQQRHEEGMAVHDAMTIEYLLHPEVFAMQKKPVRVSCEGITIGQTLMPVSIMPVEDAAFENMPVKTICTGVLSDAVKEHLLGTLRLQK